jgi:hypothetical protein
MQGETIPLLKNWKQKPNHHYVPNPKKQTKLHEHEETKGLMRITMINHTQEHDHTLFSK